jgi:shikimate dehydrogenase
MNNNSKNIALIGISGSGKTTLGRKLAYESSRHFLDLDSQIMERQDKSIDQIFAEVGEDGFRALETEVLKEAVQKSGSVISCGGGIVLREENMKLLGEKSIVVFLNRPVDRIVESIDVENRPLLRENPARILEMLRDRGPLYEKYADFEAGSNGDEKSTLEELCRIEALEQTERRLAVIGSPIGHSLSPKVHLPVLSKYLKKISYEKQEIHPQGLADWIARVRNLEFDGFNVTMPHKKAIFPYLDEIDEEAKSLDSVNTVVRQVGKLVGHNTDGQGFSFALKEKGASLCGSRVGIIGAGGAGGTLARKAAKEGAKEILLILRNPLQGQLLCHTLQETYGVNCSTMNLSGMEEGGRLSEIDLLINATPLGMNGIDMNFRSFGFLDKLNSKALVCDLIYSPAKTTFLREAEKRGFQILSGLPMLIYQAILADRLFLGAELMPIRAYQGIIETVKEGVEIK